MASVKYMKREGYREGVVCIVYRIEKAFWMLFVEM